MRLYLETYHFEVLQFYRVNGKLISRYIDTIPENFFPLPEGLCVFDGAIKNPVECSATDLEECGIDPESANYYEEIWIGSMRPATEKEILEVMYGS